DLVSGYHIAEHNDVAFIFYVTISIWAYFEYKNGGSSKWLIIIGLASGMAILVKWLPGLLVYSAWVLIQFLNKEKRWKLSNYYGIAKAFLITVLVVLPWQIYILLKFPVESAIEFKLNSRHIFEAVEGHGGGFFYHFDMMRVLYGFEWIFIVVALVLVPYKVPKRNNRISVLFYVIFVYLFFSSVATKMPSFPLISAALVYLALGVFIVIFFEMFFNYFKRSYISGRIAKPIIQSVFIGFLGITVVNIEKIQNIHTYGKSNDNGSRQIRLYNAAIIKQLPDIAVKETVVFNCRSYEGVLIMFYTDALAAYEGVPDEPLLESLIDRGINVSMFDDGYLPDYVQNNDKVYKIREGYRVN
ncbi:MAG: phospholipid carrier-dependent glycosyltransferase, partial [Bacteroidetes bacterium]|nr:phospholipid carrier-dependent glycosyltransferase [Bacteroidota bacterium]